MKRTAGTVEYARLSHERRSAGSGSLLKKSSASKLFDENIGLCRLANYRSVQGGIANQTCLAPWAENLF